MKLSTIGLGAVAALATQGSGFFFKPIPLPLFKPFPLLTWNLGGGGGSGGGGSGGGGGGAAQSCPAPICPAPTCPQPVCPQPKCEEPECPPVRCPKPAVCEALMECEDNGGTPIFRADGTRHDCL
ncbi:hypothetical protein BKA56DRAFT_620462 [Ilyonectria sp. MPI-CAGE-AT-0026]|nr:hypothetical protein BKA56DRAFT_620462 [Ilyonectria sp. MPI-CAGE-AT-0026]